MKNIAFFGRWEFVVAVFRQAFQGFLFGQTLKVGFVELLRHVVLHDMGKDLSIPIRPDMRKYAIERLRSASASALIVCLPVTDNDWL